MERGCYLQAFKLVNIVFYEVANADMDDSDGGSGMVAQTCYDYWKSLTLNAPEEEVLAIKKWFLVNKETDYVVDYMQEYIDEFYEQFSSRKMKSKSGWKSWNLEPDIDIFLA